MGPRREPGGAARYPPFEHSTEDKDQAPTSLSESLPPAPPLSQRGYTLRYASFRRAAVCLAHQAAETASILDPPLNGGRIDARIQRGRSYASANIHGYSIARAHSPAEGI